MRFSAVQTLESRFPGLSGAPTRRAAVIIDQIIWGRDAASSAQRISLIAFAIRVASAAIAFLSQVLLARLMGTYEYGVFALVWVWVLILGSLSNLGMSTAVIRFMPEYVAAGDFARLRGLLLSSRYVALGCSTIFAALGALTVWFGAKLFDSHYVLPFLVGFLAVPMVSLGDTLEGIARGGGWAIRALTPTYIVRPIALFAFMLAAWAMGFPIDGTTGILCAVAAAYTTTIWQLAMTTNHVERTHPLTAKPKTELRSWMIVALPIFLVDGFFFLLLNSDVAMVGALMNPDDVAVYYATAKTLALAHFVAFAVKAGVAHQFAAHINNPDKTELRVLARRSVAWTFWPTLGVGLVLLALGSFILGLFGNEFKEGHTLLFILMAGVVLRASIGPAESLLNMTGNQISCATIFAVTLAVNIALNAMLIPLYGLYGAAIATVSATILETALLFAIVRRSLGVSMFVLAAKPQEAS